LETGMTREEAIAEGHEIYCLQCNALYKEVPTRDYADGHNGHQLASCRRCGCDLFASLADGSKVEV
jgi:hypothetical protein